MLEAIERVKESTGKEPKQVVVDGGFTTGETIIAMSDRGIDLIGVVAEKNEPLRGDLNNEGLRQSIGRSISRTMLRRTVTVAPPGKP
jgi:hypothetical protein